MNLQIIIPLFEFEYIGENKSLNEMFIDGSKFHENLKEYVFDEQYNFRLVKYSYEDYSELEIDTLSKIDCDRLHYSNWGLLFECEKERLDEYKQKINLLLLAFRIIKQSDVQIKYLICINFPYLSIKYPDDWKYAIAESRIKRNAEAINKFELENVLDGYFKLKEFLNVSYRTSHAVNFLFLSYTSFYWMEIFLLLMTALETLVSPDKKDKIVSEVTQRVVCLINNKELCNKSKFQKIYDLRSDIIHGKVLVELNFQKELPRLQQLQKIVLETFNILLNSSYKEIYKDEYSKEDFYKKITSNEKLEKHL